MVTVNDIFKEDITKIDGKTLPSNVASMFLNDVINKLGVESSKAQGLGKTITSSDKLRDAAGHWIYLANDRSANNGTGEVVGLLKVARKSLYLYDESAAVRQVQPLCVLDFFVRPQHQRRGIGRALFDYMLKDTGSRPTELAIDGPSPLMEAFLARSYGMTRLVRQSNNFATAPEFFSDPPSRIKQNNPAPGPAPPIGRSAAPKPVSVVGDIIHGSDRMFSLKQNCPAPGPAPPIGRSAAPKPVSVVGDIIHGSERMSAQNRCRRDGKPD